MPGSAVRVGWGSEGCDNDAPVGFNAFGWSLKSTDGCIYHRADSKPYAKAPILNGDVIGCLLHLAAPVDGFRPLPSGGRWAAAAPRVSFAYNATSWRNAVWCDSFCAVWCFIAA